MTIVYTMSMNIPKTYQPEESLLVAPGIFKTSIEGLLFISHVKHTDDRGFFSEIIRIPELEAVTKTEFHIKQINHARSEERVIRGIHAENWNKFVFITTGLAFCAIVDVRESSPTFGKKEYFLMGIGEDALHGSLFIPATLGNSVCVLKGPVEYVYCVDRLYKDRDTSGDMAISVFDPDLAIEWPLSKEEMIVSERDTKAIILREKYPHKFQ